MESVTYSELYYASTEMSVLSGMPGFGVRSFTKKMSTLEIQELVDACVKGYPVYGDRILNKMQIVENPHIVYDYAPIFGFQIVLLSSGEKRYVFSRTVYLGIDYGFFKGSGNDERAGSNYFTHLIIFNKEPNINVMKMMTDSSIFVPANYTCTPSNIELVKLLTGEPDLLDPKKISLKEDADYCLTQQTNASLFICGILQMIKNRRVNINNETKKKVIVKCPDKHTFEYVQLFSLFPQETLNNIRFTTNYSQGYFVPEQYDIVFVNEFNSVELYEDDHITIDLFEKRVTNILSDAFTEHLSELIKNKDARTISAAIRYYLNIEVSNSSEYEAHFCTFILAETDIALPLETINKDVLQYIPTLKLDSVKTTQLWNKITATINDRLVSTLESGLSQTINAIKAIKEICPDKIQIQEESKNPVTNILFGEKGIFNEIANDDNISTILQLVNKNLIPSEESFLSSISESESLSVWKECLSFFYNDCYEGNSKILMTIFDSSLSENTINKLLETLYPLSRYADTLFEFFKNYPAYISHAKDTVSALVKFYGNNRFSDFVRLGQLEPEVKKIVAPIILDYFQNKVNMNGNNGVQELYDFLENVGTDQISEFNLWPIFKTLTKKCLKEPLKDIEIFLSKLKELEIHYQGQIEGEVHALTCLSKHEVPCEVNLSFIEAVIRCYPNDKPYIEQVFSAWTQNVDDFNKDVLGPFITDNKKSINDSLIASIIIIIWNNTSPDVKRDRETLILSVIDNYGWDRKKVEGFSLNCGNNDLEKFLQKSNNIFNKLIRKFLQVRV